MNNKEYLNEERYQKTKKKLFFIGVGIIAFGVLVALIIFISQSGFETKKGLEKQLSELKPTLQNRYNELKDQGFIESSDYKDEEGYEMNLIDIALDPKYEKCEITSSYSDNDTTREYCSIKAKIYAKNNPMISVFPSLFILLPCLTLGAMFILRSKAREISAFTAQQVMPVAKEGVEKMAPSAGVAAKEIAKGVKKGLKDDDEK